MEANVNEPKTFLDAVPYFKDADNCLNYLVARRWPKGVSCPTCGRTDVSFVPARRLWQCKTRHPKCQFSIKTGTILEDSPLGLDKWLPVIWLIASCKNGVSSWEIHRHLGVTQKTAWFMLHRVRLGMQDENTGGGKLNGEVEIDETFIGGKARNMHKSRKAKILEGKGGGFVGKVGVQGMLQRGGKVRAAVIEDTSFGSLIPNIQKHVEKGSHVFTDELKTYFGLQGDYTHDVINHVSVEPFHLFRYVDEQAFRYNHRKEMNDAERCSQLCTQIVGKRLTYKELTGKEGEKPDEEIF